MERGERYVLSRVTEQEKTVLKKHYSDDSKRL